MLLISVTIYN